MPNNKEREINEKIIEFNKTEPELAIELIKQAINERRKHQELLKDIYDATKKLVKKIEKDNLLNFIKFNRFDEEKYSKKYIIGIDGSFQVVGGFGKRYYIMVNAVIIELPCGLYTKVNKFNQRYSGIKIFTYDTSYNEEFVKNIAEDIMMIYETKAIEYVVNNKNGTIIFLDGPAVDPPREPTIESRIFFKKLNIENYIRYRAQVLNTTYKKNNILIGYVKSSKTDKLLRDILLSRYCTEHKNELTKFRGDEELAYSILWTISKSVINNQIFPYLGPFEATCSNNNIYCKYLYSGVKIYYFYGINKWINKAFRAEIPIPSNIELDDRSLIKLVEAIYKSILATTLPGNKHPLPIILAHEKSNIRKGAAELIYDVIISSLISDIFYKEKDYKETIFKLNILFNQPSKS